MEDLKKLTRWVWETYLGSDDAAIRRLLAMLADDAVIIGTGKQEFYPQISAFFVALERELQEREQVQFQIQDFWCEEQRLAPDTAVVYGTVYVAWDDPDSELSIRMDTRFSIVYHREGEGWRIVHLHQSVPNLEQLDGEAYAKTLGSQFKDARREVENLSRLADTDGLTGLLNYRGLQQQYALASWDGAWMVLLDIDDFKQINDQYGHLAGNQALQDLAGLLSTSVRAGDLVCRMGGDEFVLLCSGLSSPGAEALAQRLIDRVAACAKQDKLLTGISVGLSQVRPAEPLDAVLERADEALYASKANGKNRYTLK